MNEMPQQVYDLLNKEITTVVVATLDEDGSPHTAPFSWVVAKDRRTMMLGLGRRNNTIRNIRRDGRVALCILDEDNIAVSLKGQARVVREQLHSIPTVAVVQVDIVSIRSNATAVAKVRSGVRVEIDDKYRAALRDGFNELKSIQ